MEDALAHQIMSEIEHILAVLILVLMEDALAHYTQAQFATNI